MVKFTYNSRFFLIKSPENSFFSTRRTVRNSEEMAAKMAAAQGSSDVILLRGDRLSCHFLRKAPLTCQSDFKDHNKNNCKGKMFWLTRQRDSIVFIVYENLKLNFLEFINFGYFHTD